MSRDQKPGKVRMVSGAPERRRQDGDASGAENAADAADALSQGGNAQPQGKSMSLLMIGLCLVAGFGGGAAIIVLAPMLGLV
jgi:hypothetical protein